jgi:hypothetical protein
VSDEAIAVLGTVFLAIVSAFLLDRLKVQRNLAGFLRRIFEGGWWRGSRVEVALAQWAEPQQPAGLVPPTESALSREIEDCRNTGGS